MLEREYLRESLSYVLAIQDVQERIKFEFVETLLGFMSGWLVFYHVGHDIAEEAREYMTDLRHKVQKVSSTTPFQWRFWPELGNESKIFFSFQTRENFDETRMKAEELKAKYMDSKMVSNSIVEAFDGVAFYWWARTVRPTTHPPTAPIVFDNLLTKFRIYRNQRPISQNRDIYS